MVYIKKTQEQRYTDAQTNLKNQVNSLRFQKAIAKMAEIIVRKNTKNLNRDDYKEISRTVYGNEQYINTVRLRRMLNMPDIQKDVNSQVRHVLLKRNIDLEHVAGLLEKSEKISIETKKGKELQDLARFYLELLGETPGNNQPKNQFNTQINYSDLRDNDQTQTKESASTPINEEIEPKTQETEGSI